MTGQPIPAADALRGENAQREEACYVCSLPVKNGDPVLVLNDDDGNTWFVHAACQGGLVAVEGGKS